VQQLCARLARRAYTRGSAHAEFQDELEATIAPGKLEDLTALSQDILTEAVDQLPTRAFRSYGDEIVYNSRPPVAPQQ
jgi:predicted amidohydrolase YtcJ